MQYVWLFSLTLINIAIIVYGVYLIYRYRTAHRQQIPPLTPENTIIAFDIHGVLFEPNYKKIGLLIYHHAAMLKLVAYFFYPSFVAAIVKLLNKKAVPQEYIASLSNQFPGIKPYAPVMIEIANAQKPNKELFKLIEQLKDKGYTMHIFSNIGDTIYANLAQQFPHLFEYFEQICVPASSNEYIAKPNPQAFAYYLAEYNPQHKQVLFIDNRRKNIKVAQLLGIHGILFTSATDLRKTLFKR